MTPLLWQRPSQNQAQSRYHATTNGTPICGAQVRVAMTRPRELTGRQIENARVPQMQTENGGKQVTYTPSTDRVRDAYVRALRNAFIASAGEHAEEFDRWLRDHDAQVWAEGYGDDLEAHTPRNNPYRKERI